MRKLFTSFLCSFCGLLSLTYAQAQRYDFAGSSGTFTPITSATAVDDIEGDDALSSDLAIGFTFNYFGSNYTLLKVSSNGFAVFNNVTSAALGTNVIASGPEVRLVAPLWDDLSGTGGQASFVTTGIAPNRVFTMEWLNWKWGSAAASAGISFQIKLYETSNKIEFIYRDEPGTLSSPSASIGIVGNNVADFYSLSGSFVSSTLNPAGNDLISLKPSTGQVYAFTPSAVAFTAPGNAAFNVNASSPAPGSMTLTWTNGDGPYRAVFMAQTSTPNYPSFNSNVILDGVSFKASTAFGTSPSMAATGFYCIAHLYGGANSVTVTNLQDGLPYEIQVVEYNGLAGTQKYLITAGTNNPITYTIPVLTPTTASTVKVLRISSSESSISFNAGNGAKRAIFMKAGNNGTSAPVDGTTYTTSTSFGSGAQIGTSGWYCIFNGSTVPTEIIVTGLSGSTDYRIHIADYNGLPGLEKYLVPSITDNPAQFTTYLSVANLPVYTFAATAGTFSPLSGGTAVDAIEVDDAQSPAIPIGFTFRLGGVPFTQLFASSNGLLAFNGLNIASGIFNDLTNSTKRPAIAPLWDDLSGTGGQASYLAAGTAPNRTFTMEWLNWRWDNPATSAVVSFQATLYEADNKIEFTYRQDAGVITSPSASIGMAFPNYGVGNFVSLNNTSNSPSASTSTETANLTVKPLSGQVYSFTPSKLDQAITFGAMTAKTFGDPSFDPGAVSNSGMPVSYVSSNTSVVTVAGSTATIVGAGTSDITASQAGDPGFNAATPVVQSLTVNKGDQVISFTAPAGKILGDAPFALSVSVNSGLPVSLTATPANRLTFTNTTATIVNPGSVTVTAQSGANANYNAAPSIDVTFCINPAKPQITLSASPNTLTCLSPGATLQWFLEGVDLNLSTESISVSQSGNYTVVAKADNCSSVLSDAFVFTVTGLDDLRTSIAVFPNPTEGDITIDATHFSGGDEIEVALTDIAGRTVESQRGSGVMKLNLGSFSSGYYLLRINAGNEVVMKKVIRK